MENFIICAVIGLSNEKFTTFFEQKPHKKTKQKQINQDLAITFVICRYFRLKTVFDLFLEFAFVLQEFKYHYSNIL